MFVVLQHPITDLRSFSADEPKRLDIPSWPCPRDSQYVRNVGSINRRKLGGIENWIGESRLCKANRACKFQDIFPITSKENGWKVTPKFRRFFFDGHITGKFEFGFRVDIESADKNLDSKSLRNLIQFIFGLKIRIPSENQTFANSELLHCGKLLSQLYLRSSTANSAGSQKTESSPLVKASSPLLFLETLGDEQVNIPFSSKNINFHDEYGCDIKHFWLTEKDKNVRCWGLQKNKYHNSSARELRVSLLRINAMRESLELLLGALSGDSLKLAPRSMESEKIQHYFNYVVGQCFKVPASTECTDILELAHQADSKSLPGSRVALLDKLKLDLDIRNQILEKTAKNLERLEALRETRPHYGDNVMGDKNQANQVVSMGRNATFSNNTFNQIAKTLESEINLEKLADDLALLRTEMQKSPQSAEESVEAGAIAEAELEAKNGNYEKALEALSKTGKWSISVGEKIGVGLAIAAIKASCGF